MNFEYVQDAVVITGLKYLRDYNGSGTVPDGIPLDGASVSGSNFYILVETSRAPSDPKTLVADYLPRGTSTITVNHVGPLSATDTTKNIYEIKGFKREIKLFNLSIPDRAQVGMQRFHSLQRALSL